MFSLTLVATFLSLATFIAPTQAPRLQLGETAQEFLQRYDAWVEEIPAEQRAWDKLQTFEKQWYQERDAPRPTLDPYEDDELAKAYGRLTWSQSVDFVRANPQLIEQAHALASFPALGMPADAARDDYLLDHIPPAMRIILPQAMPIRAAASIVAVDLRLAAQDGDIERFLRNARTIERLASLGVVFDSMVEHRAYIAVTDAVARALLDPHFDCSSLNEQQLGALLNRLRSIDANEPSTSETLQWNHAQIISALDWFYEGAQDGHITTDGALRVLRATDILSNLRDELGLRFGEDPRRKHARTLRPMLAPYPAQVEAVDACMNRYRVIAARDPHLVRSFTVTDVVKQQRAQQPNPHALLPSLDSIPRSLELYFGDLIIARANRDAARLLIAAHLHRLRHGQLPSSTTEIDDDLLGTLPLDPYTGEPLRIRLVNGQPIIYSAGPDRDLDDARPQPHERFVPLDEFEHASSDDANTWDGDWVFNPVIDTSFLNGSDSTKSESSPTALRPGDDRLEYAQRYDEWLRTVPLEDRAWSIVDGLHAKLPAAGPDEHPQLVEQLHGILSRPVLGMPTRELGVNAEDDSDEDKLLIGLLLPHIPMLRPQSDILLVDTQRAAEQNDHNRTITNLRTLRHLGSIGSVADTLVEGIRAIKNDSAMFELILDGTLDLTSWNARSLESLANIVNAPPPWEPAGHFFDAERAIYSNFLDWIYFDAVEGQLSFDGTERLLRLSQEQDYRKIVVRIIQTSVGPREDQEQAIDAAIRAAVRDLTEPIAEKPGLIVRRVLEEHGAFNPAPLELRYMPAGLIMPAVDQFVERVLDARIRHDAAMLYIAAHRHRARHGSFPQSTEALDQDLLPHMPVDPYTDDALQLKTHDGRLVIYSLGPDRDDDNGRPLDEHRFVLSHEFSQFDQAQREHWDGDWVLTATN